MSFHLDGKRLDIRHAFKKSDEEGGMPPVKETKKPFLPKDVFENVVAKSVNQRKIFIGGIGQVFI